MQPAFAHRRCLEFEGHVDRTAGRGFHRLLRDAIGPDLDGEKITQRRGGMVFDRRHAAREGARGGEGRIETNSGHGGIDRAEIIGTNDDQLGICLAPGVVEGRVVIELPAALLVVREEEDLLDALGLLSDGLARFAERAGEIGLGFGELHAIDRLPGDCVIDRRFRDEHQRAIVHRDHRHFVPRLQIINHRLRLVLGALQADLVAALVAHAHRLIDDQGNRAGNVAAEEARRFRGNDRTSRRGDDQRHDQAAQKEQQEIFDLGAAAGAGGDDLEEAQRRERHVNDALPLPEMNDDRRSERGEAVEEPGGKKRHGSAGNDVHAGSSSGAR